HCGRRRRGRVDPHTDPTTRHLADDRAQRLMAAAGRSRLEIVKDRNIHRATPRECGVTLELDTLHDPLDRAKRPPKRCSRRAHDVDGNSRLRRLMARWARGPSPTALYR